MRPAHPGRPARFEGLSLLAAAAEFPERTALVVDGQAHSYADLATHMRVLLPFIEQRTAAAQQAGARRVALVGSNDLPTLATLYALMELGQPVVLLHPRWSRPERERMIESCAPAAQIDPASLIKTQAASNSEDPLFRAAPPDQARDNEGPLAIVPTSGSSGRPKGVVLSRRAFIASAAASEQNLGWVDEDRWLLSLPIAHVGGLSILTRCLLARRTVVVHGGERFEAADVAEIVEKQRITLLSVVPTMLRRLLALEPRWDPPKRLRAILVGGAAASKALLTAAADRAWPVLTTYGLTEACSQVTTQPHGSIQHGEMGCGPALPNTGLRIRRGIIEIRGPQLMTGYLSVSDEDPLTRDGWLRTGDLGHLDDQGNLHVLGRADDVIISGGENVRASEVEQVLEDHPNIAAACVFAVEDEEWGQVVAAALVMASPPLSMEPPTEESLWSEDLLRFLRPRLAGFKRPRRVAYLANLARLPSGKVDRRETASRARIALQSL